MRQHPRHIPQPYPRLAVPVQHTHRQPRPLQHAQVRRAVIKRHLPIPQRRHHLIGNPLPQPAILRMIVMHHHRVRPRLADHQFWLCFAVQVERDNPVLVCVELAQRSLVQRPADHATEIAGAEPGLVFEKEGEELAVAPGVRIVVASPIFPKKVYRGRKETGRAVLFT